MAEQLGFRRWETGQWASSEFLEPPDAYERSVGGSNIAENVTLRRAMQRQLAQLSQQRSRFIRAHDSSRNLFMDRQVAKTRGMPKLLSRININQYRMRNPDKQSPRHVATARSQPIRTLDFTHAEPIRFVATARSQSIGTILSARVEPSRNAVTARSEPIGMDYPTRMIGATICKSALNTRNIWRPSEDYWPKVQTDSRFCSLMKQLSPFSVPSRTISVSDIVLSRDSLLPDPETQQLRDRQIRAHLNRAHFIQTFSAIRPS